MAPRVVVPSPVAKPQPVDNFDKAYARTVTAALVRDIASADEYFLDRPEIGTSAVMQSLSDNMQRLLDAGMPPVASKARYYALVTTLEKFYGQAAGQLPDDVIGGVSRYTVAREATPELFGMLNPVLGTKYALAKWSFR